MDTKMRSDVMAQGSSILRGRYIGVACLVLLALLFWRLAADLITQDLRTSAPALDSFAEPSVCLAGLKHEGERVMLAYTEDRDAAQLQPTTSSHDDQQNRSFRAQALADFHSDLQELETDLNRKVLVAYFQAGYWSEFVDCYLQLVGQPHEAVVGEALSYSALESAQKCGRADEVADALRHVIRFHPNFHGTRAFKKALETWEARHPPKAVAGAP